MFGLSFRLRHKFLVDSRRARLTSWISHWFSLYLALIGEALECASLGNKLLVARLQLALLLDDPGDLVANELRELVAVLQYVGRDAPKKGQLLECLIHNRNNALCLDWRQLGVSHASAKATAPGQRLLQNVRFFGNESPCHSGAVYDTTYLCPWWYKAAACNFV